MAAVEVAAAGEAATDVVAAGCAAAMGVVVGDVLSTVWGEGTCTTRAGCALLQEGSASIAQAENR